VETVVSDAHPVYAQKKPTRLLPRWQRTWPPH